MIERFVHEETGAPLMIVEECDYGPGVPGLTIVTPEHEGTIGLIMDADEVKRLYEITKSWLQRNTGAIL